MLVWVVNNVLVDVNEDEFDGNENEFDDEDDTDGEDDVEVNVEDDNEENESEGINFTWHDYVLLTTVYIMTWVLWYFFK